MRSSEVVNVASGVSKKKSLLRRLKEYHEHTDRDFYVQQPDGMLYLQRALLPDSAANGGADNYNHRRLKVL